MSVGNAVGVSVRRGATSVGGICVEVGIAVSVGMVGEVGGGEEQEIKRRMQKAESSTLDGTC